MEKQIEKFRKKKRIYGYISLISLLLFIILLVSLYFYNSKVIALLLPLALASCFSTFNIAFLASNDARRLEVRLMKQNQLEQGGGI